MQRTPLERTSNGQTAAPSSIGVQSKGENSSCSACVSSPPKARFRPSSSALLASTAMAEGCRGALCRHSGLQPWLLHLYPNPGIDHGRHEPSLQRGFPELTVFSQGLWVGNDTCELEKRTRKAFDNPHPDPKRPSPRHECDLPSRLRSDRCWKPPTVGAGSEKGLFTTS